MGVLNKGRRARRAAALQLIGPAQACLPARFSWGGPALRPRFLGAGAGLDAGACSSGRT
jgi:hypothetical protein